MKKKHAMTIGDIIINDINAYNNYYAESKSHRYGGKTFHYIRVERCFSVYDPFVEFVEIYLQDTGLLIMSNIGQIIVDVINDAYHGPVYNSVDDGDTVYVCYMCDRDVLATITIGNMITISNNKLFSSKKDVSFPLVNYTDELLIESIGEILAAVTHW